MDAFKLILFSLVGWMNQQQQHVVEYLQEEVRTLKELQGEKRLLFSDEQRSRLARKAKRIRCSRLKEIVGVVTPQTLLAWHRKLIAKKYDSSGKRCKVGRPRMVPKFGRWLWGARRVRIIGRHSHADSRW